MFLTGATGGVGSCLVRLACLRGWSLLGVYRSNHDRARLLSEQVSESPGSLQMIACDLSDPDQVEKLLQQVPEEYVPDALVHLTASSLDIRPIYRWSWKDFQQQIDGTLKPLVLLTGSMVRRMAKRKSGRIIAALSSVVLETPPRGFATYSVAKFALIGYMKSLHSEYRDRGIAVNAVSPGPMETELLKNLPELMIEQLRASVPGGQFIDPESVAKAIMWLAAEAGPEITDCNLPLTSGRGEQDQDPSNA